ncbi:MAG: DUF4097 family beta strand repeat protein [Candidatus Sericytochromatia bacterium]|nr:DUF4097 family beta strand repeat protein [Candidatus Sericytochromatia bacterium]
MRASAPADGIQTLNVQIDNGDLQVQTHTENNIQVSVQAEAQGSQELKDKVTLQTIPAARSLGVRIDKPTLGIGEELKTHLSITLPAHIALELTTHNGKIQVQKQAASLSLDTQNGDIQLTDIQGDINARSANGNVLLTNISGLRHTLFSGNGTLTLKEVNGAVSAETGNGQIEAELLGVSRPETYAFSSGNGNIRLGLPADSSARLSYSKGAGSVKTDFEHLDQQQQILVGQGAARFELKASNGNIEVYKR